MFTDGLVVVSCVGGVDGAVHQSCEPSGLPPPCHHTAQHRAVLYGMVLCVSSPLVCKVNEVDFHSSDCPVCASRLASL